jgi:hypothetical protein
MHLLWPLASKCLIHQDLEGIGGACGWATSAGAFPSPGPPDVFGVLFSSLICDNPSSFFG